MEKKKGKPKDEMTDDLKLDERKEIAKSAVVGGRVFGDAYQIILLMDSVDKLKASVKKGTESSNKLTQKVKNLTKALVIIGIIAIAIGLGGVVLQFITLFCKN